MNRDDVNAAWRRWYRKNAKRKIAWQARRRLELRAWLHAEKSRRMCEVCSEAAPECLHFHHRDPHQKSITVSDVISRGWSRERIASEIAKCSVLCANCHLKHHWSEART